LAFIRRRQCLEGRRAPIWCKIVILVTVYCLVLGTYEEKAVGHGLGKHPDFSRNGRRPLSRGAAAVTDQSRLQDEDLRRLGRVISACTLGLRAFGTGLLIGVFFS
jgi:hypothetical protein